jgi:prepilin-type N-terminal cleavage/methylation domain-containing protein
MEVKKMKNQKGFTLVELLVVIAIIAVLSAVAVVNLNTARDKGIDASRKANMSALPAAAEIFYDDENGTYVDFCTDDSIDAVEAAIVSGGGDFDCFDSAGNWAAEVELEAGTFFCVDSLGNATTTNESGITDVSDCECGTGDTDCE